LANFITYSDESLHIISAISTKNVQFENRISNLEPIKIANGPLAKNWHLDNQIVLHNLYCRSDASLKDILPV
jgi:hypothetical protein